MTVTVKHENAKLIDFEDLRTGMWFEYQTVLYMVSQINTEKSLAGDNDQRVVYVMSFGEEGYNGLYKALGHWTFREVTVNINWF